MCFASKLAEEFTMVSDSTAMKRSIVNAGLMYTGMYLSAQTTNPETTN